MFLEESYIRYWDCSTLIPSSLSFYRLTIDPDRCMLAPSFLSEVSDLRRFWRSKQVFLIGC